MKYLVMAFRYGTNDYIFPVGIYDSPEIAVQEAEDHKLFRGGKYYHKVYTLEENKMYDAEEVKWVWVNGDRKGEGNSND